MEDQKGLEAIISLIIFDGDVRNDAMETAVAARRGDFTSAGKETKDAEESLVQAHHSQTEMLVQEVQGNHVEVTLLTIHSQDHLMTSAVFADLVKEIINLYRRLDA